jgi:hypothetical protein
MGASINLCRLELRYAAWNCGDPQDVKLEMCEGLD